MQNDDVSEKSMFYWFSMEIQRNLQENVRVLN